MRPLAEDRFRKAWNLILKFTLPLPCQPRRHSEMGYYSTPTRDRKRNRNVRNTDTVTQRNVPGMEPLTACVWTRSSETGRLMGMKRRCGAPLRDHQQKSPDNRKRLSGRWTVVALPFLLGGRCCCGFLLDYRGNCRCLADNDAVRHETISNLRVVNCDRETRFDSFQSDWCTRLIDVGSRLREAVADRVWRCFRTNDDRIRTEFADRPGGVCRGFNRRLGDSAGGENGAERKRGEIWCEAVFHLVVLVNDKADKASLRARVRLCDDGLSRPFIML